MQKKNSPAQQGGALKVKPAAKYLGRADNLPTRGTRLAEGFAIGVQRLKIRQSFEGGNIPKNGDDFQRQIFNSI